MIKLEHSKFVRAPKQKVYDWWTNFQETDPSLSGRIIQRRKLVSKGPAEVIYEDEGRMLSVSYKDRVIVRLFPPDKWIAEYHSSKFDATSIYSLEETDGGTQLGVVTEVEFKGWLRPFGGLAKWGIKRTIEEEWDEYLGIVEEESGKG